MDGLGDGSDGHSPSSSSDFYNHEPSNILPQPLNQVPPKDGRAIARHSNDQIDDCSSDEMDMSSGDESDGLDPPDLPGEQPSFPATILEPTTGQKRKASANMSNVVGDEMRFEEPSKRLRLPQRTSVPPGPPKEAHLDVWQQVFLRLSPTMLSRCLRVCRKFHELLTQTKGPAATGRKAKDPFDCPPLRALDSESIWSSSRKANFPHLPRPLHGFSDLQILQLAGGQSCQVCGKLPNPVANADPQTQGPGPGPDGVRIVWLFGIRVCGACLEKKTILDTDLHKDFSAAADIRLGLPPAFRTRSLHIIPRPADNSLRANKIYSRAHALKLQQDFEEARALGDGAAEEWKKGLTKIRNDAEADALKWDTWEKSQSPQSNLAQVLRNYDLPSFPIMATRTGSHGKSTGSSPDATPKAGNSNTETTTCAPSGHIALPASSHTKHPRSEQELSEAREAREQSFEKRCTTLVPPLQPNAMKRMPAFKNAMQMIRPLDDREWQSLKPLFEQQREVAEYEEYEQSLKQASLAASAQEPVHVFGEHQRSGKDQEHIDAQMPLRTMLAEWADDYLSQHPTRTCVPQLAVDCLLYVRRKFLEHVEAEKIASKTSQNPATANGTSSRAAILSLENMKWVHTNKLKPLENGETRCFLCAECGEEGTQWFSFESLLQHFNAKHTAEFSNERGAIDWRNARWPDDPPFITDPSRFIKRPQPFPTHNTRKNRGHSYSTGLLSEHPLFASNKDGPQYLTVSPATKSNTHNQHSRQSTDNNDRQEKLDMVSQEIIMIWNILDEFHGELESVRMSAALFQCARSFQDLFDTELDLDLLYESLFNRPDMKEIKNCQILACKACLPIHPNPDKPYSFARRTTSAKLRDLESLVTHFKLIHLNSNPRLDWRTEMIALPDTATIAGRITLPKLMQGQKATLTVNAVYAAVSAEENRNRMNGIATSPMIEPRLSRPKSERSPAVSRFDFNATADIPLCLMNGNGSGTSKPHGGMDSNLASKIMNDAMKKLDSRRQDRKKKKKKGQSASVEKIKSRKRNEPVFDPTEYDTALSGKALEEAQHRSPSVGAPDLVHTIQPQRLSSTSLPPGQPDIGAILAALTCNSKASSVSHPTPPPPAVAAVAPPLPPQAPVQAQQYAAPLLPGHDLQAAFARHAAVPSVGGGAYGQPQYRSILQPSPGTGYAYEYPVYHQAPAPLHGPAAVPQYGVLSHGERVRLYPVRAVPSPVGYIPQAYEGQHPQRYWPAS